MPDPLSKRPSPAGRVPRWPKYGSGLERTSLDTGKMKAFSDGAIAIPRSGYRKAPHGTNRHALQQPMQPMLYSAAIGAAFLAPCISLGFYTLVELMGLIPDRRIETALACYLARAGSSD